MVIEVKGKQVFHYDYTFQLNTTEKQFFFLTGREGAVLYIDYVSIYNPSANDYTHVYLLHKHRGKVDRCDYAAGLATVVVKKFTPDSYLADGMELGLAITGSATSDTIDVSVHGIMFKD